MSLPHYGVVKVCSDIFSSWCVGVSTHKSQNRKVSFQYHRVKYVGIVIVMKSQTEEKCFFLHQQQLEIFTSLGCTKYNIRTQSANTDTNKNEYKQTHWQRDVTQSRTEPKKKKQWQLWTPGLLGCDCEGYMVHSLTWSPTPSGPNPVTLILYSPVPSANPRRPILESSWWRLFCQLAPRQQHQRVAGCKCRVPEKQNRKIKKSRREREIFPTAPWRGREKRGTLL